MKKILVLIAAACSVGLGQAHAVSVVNWELTDFDNDGKRSDFSFAAAPSGMSALKFGYSGETGCTNAPDGNHCVPIITDGRSYLADVFTTGFDFTGNNVYFKPNLEIPGGIRADITNNTLTFSVLNWAGRFPGATGAQFFIPPNDKQLIDDPNDPNQQIEIGTIDPSFVNVETLTDLGGGRYGVVVRWKGRVLNSSGSVDPAFSAFVGSWRVEGVMSTVPIPAAAWLLGSGMFALVAVARRRKGST